MFGAARSQVSSARCRPTSSRCDPLLYPTIIYSYLTGSHSVDLSLIVDIGAFHVNLVELSISPCHHVIVMNSGKMLSSTSEAFGRKNFLLWSDNVDTLLRLIDLTF